MHYADESGLSMYALLTLSPSRVCILYIVAAISARSTYKRQSGDLFVQAKIILFSLYNWMMFPSLRSCNNLNLIFDIVVQFDNLGSGTCTFGARDHPWDGEYNLKYTLEYSLG